MDTKIYSLCRAKGYGRTYIVTRVKTFVWGNVYTMYDIHGILLYPKITESSFNEKFYIIKDNCKLIKLFIKESEL